MGYFNARVSVPTANLLMEMIKHYEGEQGISISKGTAINMAFQDARWVPADKWDRIRDYSKVQTADYAITASGQKLKVNITTQVEEALIQLDSQLRLQFKVRYIKTGTILAYILKAAYIKYRDPDFIAELTGQNRQSSLEELFAQAKAQLRQICAPSEIKQVQAVLDQLQEEIRQN